MNLISLMVCGAGLSEKLAAETCSALLVSGALDLSKSRPGWGPLDSPHFRTPLPCIHSALTAHECPWRQQAPTSELYPPRPAELPGPAAALGHSATSLQPGELRIPLPIPGAQGELPEGPEHRPCPAPPPAQGVPAGHVQRRWLSQHLPSNPCLELRLEPLTWQPTHWCPRSGGGARHLLSCIARGEVEFLT